MERKLAVEFNKKLKAKRTFDMVTIMTCSLKLNGPGLRLNLMPNTVKTRSGKMRSQPKPIGYAMSWIASVDNMMLGFRSESSMFTAEPMVQSNRPIVQARMVLTGISTS